MTSARLRNAVRYRPFIQKVVAIWVEGPVTYYVSVPRSGFLIPGPSTPMPNACYLVPVTDLHLSFNAGYLRDVGNAIVPTGK
jgi:hypothetical protein